jgi:hypothetical protein
MARFEMTDGKIKLPPNSETWLRPWQQGAIFLLACAVIVSRRPDAIFHPQFYAEDGHVWFADAYNLGWWHALFRAQDGYFQTFPRLAAALALLAPLSLAPLVLNIAAVVVEALPVNILLSSRSSAWGSLGFRACLAGAYLALPNSREMTISVTSSQWILALCAFLVLAASLHAGSEGRIFRHVFDLAVLILCGLTGPFSFFLLPIAGFIAWKSRTRWHWVRAGALFLLALVQAWGLLVVDRGGRSPALLGATAELLIRILGGQIYFATLLGGNGVAASSSHLVFILLVLAVIAGTLLVVFCFVHSNIEMRLFFVLTAMLLAASLISPAAYPPHGVTRWQLLAEVPGIRYWYFPTLACVWSVLWLSRSRIEALKAAAIVLLCAMCFGVVRDWKQPALRDLGFGESARSFQAAPPGTIVDLPENPRGWTIRLVKHSSN